MSFAERVRKWLRIEEGDDEAKELIEDSKRAINRFTYTRKELAEMIMSQKNPNWDALFIPNKQDDRL